MESPAIYAASLSDYNAGRLHGAWINLEDCTTENEIRDAINDMLADSPEPNAEEWAIHDTNALPSSLRSEHTSLSAYAVYGELLLSFYDTDAVDAYLDLYGRDVEPWEWEDDLSERFLGVYASPEDWAAEYMDETGQLSSVPETVARYFDYEAYARDAQLSGDIDTVSKGGSVYVFYNH